MTNYEYLQKFIDNRAAVDNFFCRMIESVIPEDEYCDAYCPMADRCHKGHCGFTDWLNQEHVTPMPDWGKYR